MLTRRDIIIKWSGYGLASLLLLFLFALTLRDVKVLGVGLFLPPLLVGVVASVEETRAATIYGLVCGVICDVAIAGTFPCVYTIAFTLAALCSALLAQSVLQRGVICSLAVTALTFAFVDALNMLALLVRGRASIGALASVTLRETLASCLLLVAVHPLMMFLHRKFTL